MAGVGSRLARTLPVELERGFRLAGEIHEFWHGRLHAVRHLVLGDSRLDLRVGELFVLDSVERRKIIEEHPATITTHAFRVRQIEHRIALRTELHALEATRQESAAPKSRVKRLTDAPRSSGSHHDERRQVLVLGSEAVREPRSDARSPSQLRTGLEEGHRGIVIDRLGVHRPDERELVGNPRSVRQQLAHPSAGFPVLPEVVPGLVNRERLLGGRHAGQTLASANGIGQFRTVELLEPWLVVEEVELRRPAALEQVDDVLGLGRKVREPRQAAHRGSVSSEQMCQPSNAQAGRTAPEEVAPGQMHC